MKIYITDGDDCSFYTAVFDAFKEKECIITSDENIQLSFDSEVYRVTTDENKCKRVRDGIAKYDRLALEEIAVVLKSCDKLKEQTAFEYVKLIMQYKAPVRKMLSVPQVIVFNETLYKVNGETHLMKGFLRFMESRDGTLYAPYSPDNDITELILPHFTARFANEKFVIHDLKRKIAALYNGKETIIGYAGDVEIYLSEYEKAFENLWKRYYNSINIEQRPHEKQMKGYMPVRYWKFLPEKKGGV